MSSLLDQQLPPEPMAALTNHVISPANIARDARIHRAKPLGRIALWILEWRCRWLKWKIQRSGHKQMEARLAEIEPELKVLLNHKYDLAQKRQLEPDAQYLRDMWEELRAEMEPKVQEYKQLKATLAAVDELYETYKTERQRIHDNPAIIARAKRDRDLMEKHKNECKNYEAIIVDRWTSMGYAHRYKDRRGNNKVDRAGFSERHITPESIFLKIGITEIDWHGGIATKIPYHVNVADLVKPETLEELSLACQRQITAAVDYIKGSWLIVNRLDTTDGLLNQVRYADVIQKYPTKLHQRFPICAGVAERKVVQWLNLTDFPHGLIAGFTGSGKSNFINAIICTLITQHDPADMRLILVDLKDGVEFATYQGIPHLYGPIVESVSDLADKLEDLIAIMGERYQKIKGKALNIAQYNAKNPSDHMARIIVIVDEVVSTIDQGDLTKRIGSALKQLVAKGRASGIHIILSTQRPSVDAIQGLIKVNLNFRIVGRMPSHADSLTVLGSGAAKDLPAIPGRMVMQLGPDPVPVQTPMIDEHDVEEALKIAMEFEPAEAIPVPFNHFAQQEWTPERVVALSINHLGGNVTHKKVWEEIKEDGSLSRSQTRALCERIWAMDGIEHEGIQYKVVTGRGGAHRLEVIEPTTPEDTEITS